MSTARGGERQKVRHPLLCILGALLCSCHAIVGFPDRRTADIVIVGDLQGPTEEAIAWWNAATQYQVDFRIAGKCSDDKRRACITMHVRPLDKMGGLCTNWSRLDGSAGSVILIDPSVANGPEEEATHVVAHELGHALGLEHVFNDPLDLMRPKGYGASCIMRPATAQQWSEEYSNNRTMMVCNKLGIAGFARYNIRVAP